MSYFYEQESAAFKACVESLKKENKKVAVIGHVRPDGDCIGSTVAMVRILRNQGIDAVGLNNDEAPDNLKFLIGDTPFYLASEFANDDRICITVDSADYKRVGPSLNTMFPNVFLNVDHHISNKQYAEKDIIHHHAYANNYDYNRAIYLMGEENMLDNGFVLIKQDTRLASPVGCLYFDYYDTMEHAKKYLKEMASEIQCVVGHLPEMETVPFGNAQFPNLDDYADGVDTMAFLLKN